MKLFHVHVLVSFLTSVSGLSEGSIHEFQQLKAPQTSKSRISDASASASFTFGDSGAQFDFRVDITRTSKGYSIIFDLDWPGMSSLNASLSSVTGGNKKTDSMCIYSIHGDFSMNVRNGYDVSKPGDCSGPFGSACVAAMKKSYEYALLDSLECPSTSIPAACKNKLSAFGIQSFTQSSFRLNHTGEYFAQFSSAQTSGGDGMDLYNQELHALQVALFAAKHTSGKSTAVVVQPVCLIVEPAKAKADDGPTTTTTHDGAAMATAMPGVGALILPGLGVVAGVL